MRRLAALRPDRSAAKRDVSIRRGGCVRKSCERLDVEIELDRSIRYVIHNHPNKAVESRKRLRGAPPSGLQETWAIEVGQNKAAAEQSLLLRLSTQSLIAKERLRVSQTLALPRDVWAWILALHPAAQIRALQA
jgi:hypothetical protein